MPHKTQTNTTYDSGDFVACDGRVPQACGLERLFQARGGVEEGRQAARPRHLLFPGGGVGLQRPHGAALRPERHGDHRRRHPFARAGPRHRLSRRWCRSGSACRSRTSAMCRATPTRCSIGRGTYGSRSMQVGGNALKKAADAIIEKAKPMAAHLMEAAVGDVEFKDGRFGIVGTDRSMALTDVAKAFFRPAHLPQAVRGRAGGVGLVRQRAAELSQRLPHLRGGDRPADRRGRGRALRRGRRRRPRDESSPVRGPDPRRRGAGRRAGADGADRLRRRRPARDRQLPGLLHAARRRSAGD